MTAYRRRPCPSLAALAAAVLLPSALAAQLRPLEPMDWRAYDRDVVVLLRVGGDVLLDQRASPAGVMGRVVEAPAATISWTTGRVVLRALIDPLRMLDPDSTFDAPLPGTDEPGAGRIRDAGDNALETIVRVTPDASTATLVALRWGVRLSTHNDRKGLDRHKTDVYGLAGWRTRVGALTVTGEAGMGAYGTRQPATETSLPFVYAAGVRLGLGVLEPSLAWVGQTTSHPFRGNEDLSELRAGLRLGRSVWLEPTWVRGCARFSPRWGLIVTGGAVLLRH